MTEAGDRANAAIQCARFRVRGRVQGVFYRASAGARARELGLRGWVRNGDDGSVEVVACGTTAQLEAIAAWLAVGPRDARVESVQRMDEPLTDYANFSVRR
jgi:acylphosphatase